MNHPLSNPQTLNIRALQKLRYQLAIRVDYEFDMTCLRTCMVGWLQSIMDGSMVSDDRFVDQVKICNHYGFNARDLHDLAFGFAGYYIPLNRIKRKHAVALLDRMIQARRYVPWPADLDSLIREPSNA